MNDKDKIIPKVLLKLLLILLIAISFSFFILTIYVLYVRYNKPIVSENSITDVSEEYALTTEEAASLGNINSLDEESSDSSTEEDNLDSDELITYGLNNIITFQSRVLLEEEKDVGKDYVGYEYSNVDKCYRITTAVIKEGTEESVYKRVKSLVLKQCDDAVSVNEGKMIYGSDNIDCYYCEIAFNQSFCINLIVYTGKDGKIRYLALVFPNEYASDAVNIKHSFK